MFRILLAKKARKFFESLNDKSKAKIFDLFEVLESNPWPAKEFDLDKVESLEDCFRIRVGKVRVCYQINLTLREITVYRMEFRSETTYK